MGPAQDDETRIPSPATVPDRTEETTRGGDAPGSVWVSLDDLDEATIVARAQDGDLDAFEWLVSAYQGGVFRLAFRMLGDHAEAEDVVQETFIAAWRNLPTLSAPQAFIPWLYRSATNKCFDLLRGRQRRPVDAVSFDDDGGPGGPAAQPRWEDEPRTGRLRTPGSRTAQDPALRHETEAQMQALADLLQTVPAGPRACWLLRDVHEFSYAEIAEIVQLPESTVRGRIARARRFLAEGMQPWR
ncbi:RNA polymerase sigma factor [Arthrobacter sp. Ld5]|uniref:RNA polymerase sigma factor n=1 Tax=Arthrobacter sp. Ld5 TaxID=649152 RepID=UPI003EB762BD